jgi:hypothetical protein
VAYRLNPQLVREPIPTDREYIFSERFIFLRDPKPVSGGHAVGIGDVIASEFCEDLERSAEFAECGEALDRLFPKPGSNVAASECAARIYTTSSGFGYLKEHKVVLVVRPANLAFTTS